MISKAIQGLPNYFGPSDVVWPIGLATDRSLRTTPKGQRRAPLGKAQHKAKRKSSGNVSHTLQKFPILTIPVQPVHCLYIGTRLILEPRNGSFWNLAHFGTQTKRKLSGTAA